MKNNSKALRISACVTTILFSFFLVWALYLKFGQYSVIYSQHINLHQFTGYERLMIDINPFAISPLHGDPNQARLEIILNGIVTIPLGIALNTCFKKPSLWKTLLIGFLFSLAIEITQFCTLIGGFTPSDLIMNTIGCFLGWGIYHIIIKNLPNKINLTLFTLGNAILIGILVYAIITVIDCKDLLVEIFKENHLKTIPWK